MEFVNGALVKVLAGEHAGKIGTVGGYDVDHDHVEVIFEDDTHHKTTVEMHEDNLVLAGYECIGCGDWHEGTEADSPHK